MLSQETEARRATMAFLSEAAIEQALLDQLAGLGYVCTSDEEVGPDGTQPERGGYGEVVLRRRYEHAVARLNPDMPVGARRAAVNRVLKAEFPDLLVESRRLHTMRREGGEGEDDGAEEAGRAGGGE